MILPNDDTKLFRVVKPKIDYKELQEDFIILRDCVIKHHMKFSVDKHKTL